MANVKALKIGNTSYDIRDENSLRSLDSTKYDEVTTYGTYDGVEVENGEVFTNEIGKFQEFSKELQTGETAFSEKESFPGSTGNLFVTKIIKSVGGVDTPFYMAVGDDKVFTSNDGVFSSTPTSTTGTFMQKAPLYLNGVWLIRNMYAFPSFSNNDGTSWTVRSSGDYPALMNNYGVVGNYFYICSEANKYTLSPDADTWTKYSFTKAKDLAYDGEYYYLLSENKIYKTTTPTDVDSWVLVTTVTNISSSPGFLKYNNGKFYTGYMDGYGYGYVYHYFYTDDITSTTWTEFSQTFGGNYDDQAKHWLEFIDDLIFIFVHYSNSTDELYQTTDNGQTFTQITNPSQYATVVGDELWYVTGGKVYSLNPAPHWEYTLTDLSGASIDQANAPTSSDEGYIGKLWITSGGAVYICTGVSGSTYTWAQVSVS